MSDLESRMDRLIRVPGKLTITGGPHDAPVEMSMGTTRGADGAVEISIVIEKQTEWVLTLDPAVAAYLAGSLAELAGVTFG